MASVYVPIVSQEVGADESAGDRLAVLLDHAENLNVRLPLLKVSVRAQPDRLSLPDGVPVSPYVFVLHGLFGQPMTAQNLSVFLERVTQDLATFMAYVKAQSIAIAPERTLTAMPSVLAN